MPLKIIIGNSTIFSTSLLGAFILFVIFISLLIVIARIIWRKLMENENLKYEFITIIAHKFRTPLTSIKWILENSLQDKNDPQIKEAYTNIQESNDKLINLTSTLIELTNLEREGETSYVFENIHLCDFSREVGESFKVLFHEKNIFFGVKCEPVDIIVKADKARLEFVIQTLLENARNYTPPGRNVEMSIAQSDNHAVISVSDNGIGISQSDIKNISHKFFRTENAKQMDTEGFGIGLYLANSIIKKHRGALDVFSPGLNKGSVFSVFIPMVRQ